MDKQIKITLDFLIKGLDKIKDVNTNLNNAFKNVGNKQTTKQIEQFTIQLNSLIDVLLEGIKILEARLTKKLTPKIDNKTLDSLKTKLDEVGISFQGLSKNKEALEDNFKNTFKPIIKDIIKDFNELKFIINSTGKEINDFQNNIKNLPKKKIKLNLDINTKSIAQLEELNILFGEINKKITAITAPKTLHLFHPSVIVNTAGLVNLLTKLETGLWNVINAITTFNKVSEGLNQRIKDLITDFKIVSSEINKVPNINVRLNFKTSAKDFNDFVKNLKNLNKSLKETYDYKSKLEENFKKDFPNAVKNASQSLKQLNQQINDFNNNTNSSNNNINDFNEGLGRWALALFGLSFGLSRVSEFLDKFYKTLIEITSEFELNIRILNGFIQSITITKQVWNELLNLALTTPFTLREILDGYKNLISTGNSYKESLEITNRAIGVAIAFDQELGSVLMNIGRALEGDAQAWKNLRHQITLTNTKIKELGGVLDSSGRLILNNEEALKKNREALLKYLETYEDVAVASNLSLKQMMSNLEDLRDQMFNTFGQATLEATKFLIKTISDLGFKIIQASKNTESLKTSLNGLFLTISITSKGLEVVSKNVSFLSDLLIVIDSIIVLMIARARGLLPPIIANLLTIRGLLMVISRAFVITTVLTIITSLIAAYINAKKKAEELQQAIVKANKVIQDSFKDLGNINKNLNENIITFSKGILKSTKAGKDLKDTFTGVDVELKNIRNTLKKINDEELEDFKVKIQELKISEINKEDLETLRENFSKAAQDIKFYSENINLDKLNKNFGKNFKIFKDTFIEAQNSFQDILNNIDLMNEEKIKESINNLNELSKTVNVLKTSIEQIKNSLGKDADKILDFLTKELGYINDIKKALNDRLDSLEKAKNLQRDILNYIKREQEIREYIKKELADFNALLETESKRFATELDFKNIITFIETGKEGVKGFNKNLLESLKETEILGEKWQELASRVSGSTQLVFDSFKNTNIQMSKETEETLLLAKEFAERNLNEFTNEFSEKFEKLLDSSNNLFQDIESNLKELARSDSIDTLNRRYNEFNESLKTTVNILIKQREIINKMITSGLLPEDKKTELKRFLSLLDDRIEKLKKIEGLLPTFKQKIELQITSKEEERKKEEDKKRKEEESKEKELKRKEKEDEIKKSIEKLIEKNIDLANLLEGLKDSIINLFSLNDKTFKEILVYLNKNVLQGSNINSLLDLISKIFSELKELYKEDLNTLKNIEKLQKSFTVGVFKGIIDNIGNSLKEVKEGIKNVIKDFKSEIEKFLPKQAKSITANLTLEISKQREKLNDIWQKIDDTKKEIAKTTDKEEAKNLQKKLTELTIEFRTAGMNLSALENIKRMTEQYERSLIFQAEVIARMRGVLDFGKRYESLEDIPEDILEEAKKAIGDYLPKKINEELSRLQREIEKKQEPEDIFKQAVNTFSESITEFKNAVNELKNTKISVDVKVNGGESKTVDLNPFVK